MEMNEKTIRTKEELINIIKEGKNPLAYIKTEKDIDFISNTIMIEGNEEEAYWEETAEIVFKAILYYVLFSKDEKRTLQRCKEIAELGISKTDGIEEIRNILAQEERASILFKAVEIAPEKTVKKVLEKINKRLSKI